MAFSKNALFRRAVYISAFAWLMMPSSVASADALNDLLNETERALGRGGPAQSVDENSEKEDKAADAAKKNIKNKNSEPQAKQPSSGQNSSDQNAQPGAKPVLTPTDAESVNELISVGLRRESKLRVNEKEQQLSFAVGTAFLRGSHRLTKDDDTFETRRGASLRNVTIAYLTDLFASSQKESRTIAGGQIKTVAGLSAGYLQGPVAVNRRGVQNGKVNVDYTILPISAGLGFRYMRDAVWGVSAIYGPTAEMILQSGSGDSDSTSGFFVADALDFSVQRKISGNFWLGLALQNRGVLPVAGGEAGHRVIALTLNTPMVGRSHGM